MGEQVEHVPSMSPTVAQIVAFWNARRQGASLALPIDGFTLGSQTGHKARQLEWCVAEAIRLRHRKFLSAAGSATLTQDGRGKHLLVMVQGCSMSLQTQVNHISLVATQSGATNLCLATIQAIAEFCTPGVGRPWKTADSPPDVVDVGLQNHLCGIISWWFTDAAYDECAAGELLISSPDARAAFPNLRIIGRERAHASRRILSRPQKADDYLSEVADRFLWDKDSIAALVQHSRTVGDVWRSAPLPPGTVDTEDCWELMEGSASSVPRVLSRFPLPVETLELSVLPTPE